MNLNFRKRFSRVKCFALCYSLVLAAATFYVLLDAFVIRREYTAITPEPQEETTSQGALWTENGYSDDTLTVRVSTQRVKNTTVYVADVVMTDVSRFKTAFADDIYGRNVTETVSDIALAKNAILAVNGDYYGARRSGYVIRGGVLYRAERADADQQDLCVWPDGTISIIREGNITAGELLSQGVSHVFCFGPALVEEGKVCVAVNQEVGQAMTSNPRTALAMVQPLHYLFIVADGRTSQSEGLTLYELAEFARDMGAQVAYNLDGGGSSTMVFGGQVINVPTTNGKRVSEREVSDIVYIQ